MTTLYNHSTPPMHEHGSRNRCAALQCEHAMTARQKNGQLFNRGLQPLHLEVEWAVLKLASAPSVSENIAYRTAAATLDSDLNRWKSLGMPLMTAGLGRPVSLQVPLTRKQAFCCSSEITRRQRHSLYIRVILSHRQLRRLSLRQVLYDAAVLHSKVTLLLQAT